MIEAVGFESFNTISLKSFNCYVVFRSTQNRHQKVFNRGLCVSVVGLWVCARGLAL